MWLHAGLSKGSGGWLFVETEDVGLMMSVASGHIVSVITSPLANASMQAFKKKAGPT